MNTDETTFTDEYGTEWALHYRTSGRFTKSTHDDPGSAPDVELVEVTVGGVTVPLKYLGAAFREVAHDECIEHVERREEQRASFWRMTA